MPSRCVASIVAALVVAASGPALASETPPSDSGTGSAFQLTDDGARTALGRSLRWDGAVVLLLGGAATAHAAWSWGAPDAYAAFMLAPGDPGPSIDPTPLFSPATAAILCGAGGANLVRGVALIRGAEPRIAWTHWLGYVPAAIAVGAELGAVVQEGPPTRAQELTVAIGTVASALWFAGSTAAQVMALPTGRPDAARAEGRAAIRTSIVPVVGAGAGRATVGLAMTGSF